MANFIASIRNFLFPNLNYRLRPPKKASELLKLALADLAKVEANPQFQIDMGEWFTPRGNETCAVCFAGAVMASTIGCDVTKFLCPTDVTPGWTAALQALNEFRRGKIERAYSDLKREVPHGIPARIEVPPYYRDPKAWRQEMNALVAMLEKAGD